MSRASRVAFTAFLAAGISAPALAEDCRAIPFGPERRACTMREHPGTFQAKQARCKQLGEERGFWLSDHRTQHEQRNHQESLHYRLHVGEAKLVLLPAIVAYTSR